MIAAERLIVNSNRRPSNPGKAREVTIKLLPEVVWHLPLGRITWDPRRISLYQSKKQKHGCLFGHQLLREVERKKPLNANFLDFLLKNTDRIPEEWFPRRLDPKRSVHHDPSLPILLFMGTVYEVPYSGEPYVRYLNAAGSGFLTGNLGLNILYGSDCVVPLLNP